MEKLGVNLLKRAGDFLREPELFKNIICFLDKTIKNDYAAKITVFLTGLSAYLPEPINLFLRGPSSIGKTYNATQVLRIFPQEDIWYLGGLSPTALIHQYGVLVDENLEPLEKFEKQKPDPADYGPLGRKSRDYQEDLKSWIKKMQEKHRNSRELVDMSGKILVFLEAPNIKTLNMLRPILSHDKREISYRFTDKTSSGKLRTHHTIIRGWPATIFLCSVDKYLEDLATRSFTVSPEESREKIGDANDLTMMMAMAPWKFDFSEDEELIRKAIEIIKSNFKPDVLGGNIHDVVIPFNLKEYYPYETPRDMRDFKHLIQLIKTVAALHFMQRPRIEAYDKKYVVASRFDVEFVLNLFDLIIESTRAGASQHILDFYHKVVKQREEWKLKDLVVAYNEAFTQKRSRQTIRRYLSTLEDIGYVTTEESEEDKRTVIFKPLIFNGEKCSITTISEMVVNSGFDWRKEAEKWLKNYVQNNDNYIKIVYVGRKLDVEKLSKEETIESLIDNIICKPVVWTYFSGLFSRLKSKNNFESMTNSKLVVNEHFFVENKPFVSLVQITSSFYPHEHCAECGRLGVDYQITFPDGKWQLICAECARKWKASEGR